MFTRLTTTLMASAFALASVAAPTQVRADNDAGKVIAGLAVGAIIGAAIASDNGRDRHGGGYRNSSYDGHDRGYQGHDSYGPERRVNLPGACRVHSNYRSGYSGRCLNGYNYGYSALPSDCAVHIGGYHGTVYRDRCLNRYGYY
ncbi:putative membrane protein [Roseovarius sp. MBR-78]|jgi:uncharacterized membrane protein|uniref:hypothetical protein n=1 Tax=Roseovarius sp. MBR-78 TaxID=3156460 RepID=UPI0033953376